MSANKTKSPAGKSVEGDIADAECLLKVTGAKTGPTSPSKRQRYDGDKAQEQEAAASASATDATGEAAPPPTETAANGSARNPGGSPTDNDIDMGRGAAVVSPPPTPGLNAPPPLLESEERQRPDEKGTPPPSTDEELEIEKSQARAASIAELAHQMVQIQPSGRTATTDHYGKAVPEAQTRCRHGDLAWVLLLQISSSCKDLDLKSLAAAYMVDNNIKLANDQVIVKRDITVNISLIVQTPAEARLSAKTPDEYAEFGRISTRAPHSLLANVVAGQQNDRARMAGLEQLIYQVMTPAMCEQHPGQAQAQRQCPSDTPGLRAAAPPLTNDGPPHPATATGTMRAGNAESTQPATGDMCL